MPISSIFVVPWPRSQRDAIQEERARERAQDEVLVARLGAFLTAPLDGRQHVHAQRHDFERDER
jgi:hypothetical protein